VLVDYLIEYLLRLFRFLYVVTTSVSPQSSSSWKSTSTKLVKRSWFFFMLCSPPPQTLALRSLRLINQLGTVSACGCRDSPLHTCRLLLHPRLCRYYTLQDNAPYRCLVRWPFFAPPYYHRVSSILKDKIPFIRLVREYNPVSIFRFIVSISIALTSFTVDFETFRCISLHFFTHLNTFWVR